MVPAAQPSARSRGRPRSFDPDRALARAAERFRTLGYSGASLDELAAASGLGRPSLYAAFGDKRRLYLAAIRRAHAAQEAQLAALAEAAPPLHDALARLFASAIHAYLSGERGPGGCLVLATAPAEAAGDEAIRDALAAFVEMQERGLEAMLAAADSPEPAADARLAAAVLHSLSARARAGEPRDRLERLARDAIRLVAG